MKINTQSCPLPVSDRLVQIIQSELGKVKHPLDHMVTLNFRDPDYSTERGGFHPVEIMIGTNGDIEYITDFAFCHGPYPELVKEIDFDFQSGIFGHIGRNHPIESGIELYKLWESNFIEYFKMGVYSVEVSE
jgi:hypothetical protein